MKGPARLVLSLAVAFGAANLASGQVNSQPTPEPIVTAQNDAWYLNGEPVAYAGHLYYPTGPQTYFNRYEMVRSGFVQGIPLYTRTTIEPYSMVFVPIGGGLMQPYERRREGDVAGTVGSTTPSFPGTRAFEPVSETIALPTESLMAAAPPTRVGEPAVETSQSAIRPSEQSRTATTIGTSGGEVPLPARDMARTPSPGQSRRRGSPNAVFIAYDGSRWFSSGAAVLMDNGFVRIGEYHGLPVYTRGGDASTIYVPVQRDADLLARYAPR